MKRVRLLGEGLRCLKALYGEHFVVVQIWNLKNDRERRNGKDEQPMEMNITISESGPSKRIRFSLPCARRAATTAVDKHYSVELANKSVDVFSNSNPVVLRIS